MKELDSRSPSALKADLLTFWMAENHSLDKGAESHG
jgi:hypothetical protein